jgi:endonuclease/exonuclease/phosphatase family metal-dependent hydrolase
MHALSTLITSLSPTVIALQEVTHSSLTLLSSSPWFSHYYSIPHPTNEPYFTLLLSLYPPTSSHRIPFISNMGRDLTLLALDLTTPLGLRRVVVSTSHLESLWQSKERRGQQLKQGLTVLNEMGGGSLVLMGDMNLKGKEGGGVVKEKGFVDVWEEEWEEGKEEGNDEKGYTMDGSVNEMVKSGKKYKQRLDRVFAKWRGWEVERIRRVGMEAVHNGVWISDHFGLLTELKVK